jgi:hypothetical protein
METAWPLLSELRSVETLEFIDIFIVDFGLAVDIIHRFPRLQTLLFANFALAKWKWASNDTVEKRGHGPSSTVIIVGLSQKTLASITPWISSLAPVPKMELPTLTCQAHNSTPSCQFWRNIFCSSAISIEHLRIDYNIPISSDNGM